MTSDCTMEIDDHLKMIFHLKLLMSEHCIFNSGLSNGSGTKNLSLSSLVCRV